MYSWSNLTENELQNISFYCLRVIFREKTAQVWNEYQTSDEYQTGANAFTVVILALFSFIIFLLLFRTMNTAQTADNQVSIMLNTMRARVESEDNARRLKLLRDAKRKALGWLQDLRNASKKPLKLKSRHSSLNKDAIPSTVNAVDKTQEKNNDKKLVTEQSSLPQIVITTVTTPTERCKSWSNYSNSPPTIIEHGSPVYV